MKKNGYTLVELIVTIGLIATAATVILVNMVGMRSDQDVDNSKKFKNAIAAAACTYIDMSDPAIAEKRNLCKSDPNNSACKVNLEVLLNDTIALVDPDLKDPETNCTAEKEKNKVYVTVKFEKSTSNGRSVYEKKCEFNRTEMTKC
jgi:prepilin-type N-terminal cleavage/methylation domain-containing protein